MDPIPCGEKISSLLWEAENMSVNMARYGVVSQLKCTWTCIAGEEPDLGREGNVILTTTTTSAARSEEHTSELQSR